MHSPRILELLILGLSAFSVAEANYVNIEMVARNVMALAPRQAAVSVDTGSVTAQATTTPPSATTQPTTSSSSSTTSTTSTTSSTKASSTTTHSPTTPTTAPATTPSSTTAPTTTEAPNTSASLETITQVITTTNSDGQQTTITSASTSTTIPGLANNAGSGSAQGMSPQTRNTVIGVVVGVGGAIILAGLAFVAWRIWGRKKGPDESDGLMDYNNNVAEKPETGGSTNTRTPFQSTLESYHAPTAVNVNASSNF